MSTFLVFTGALIGAVLACALIPQSWFNQVRSSCIDPDCHVCKEQEDA